MGEPGPPAKRQRKPPAWAEEFLDPTKPLSTLLPEAAAAQVRKPFSHHVTPAKSTMHHSVTPHSTTLPSSPCSKRCKVCCARPARLQLMSVKGRLTTVLMGLRRGCLRSRRLWL